MQGITKSGFEYNIDERILTDWRFTTAAVKAESGSTVEKVVAAQKMIEMMLGEEQLNQLVEHIASQNDGFVPTDAIMNVAKEIIEDNKKVKN
jgi:hypothetical protein